jgi:hypothetical protein
MDGFYPLLHLPLSASSREVVRAAAKAIHPSLRRLSGLRLARCRFYRDMLNAQTAARAHTRQTVC